MRARQFRRKPRPVSRISAVLLHDFRSLLDRRSSRFQG